MNNMPKQILECPRCGAEVRFASYEKMKFCPDCGKLLELDSETELLDGRSHDLSKLIERKPE